MADKVADTTKSVGDNLNDPAKLALAGNRKPAADLVKGGPDVIATALAQEREAGKQAAGGATDSNKGSLRIHIDLDLEVEVHLTARIKGEITIGLL